jgi:hypothetical protein
VQHPDLVTFNERDFEYLIGVAAEQLIKRQFEELKLKLKIPAFRSTPQGMAASRRGRVSWRMSRPTSHDMRSFRSDGQAPKNFNSETISRVGRLAELPLSTLWHSGTLSSCFLPPTASTFA